MEENVPDDAGMWQLRRKGFFVYLAGELIPLILMLILLFVTDTSKLDTLAFLSWIGWVILPVVFILLYMNNLKYLH